MKRLFSIPVLLLAGVASALAHAGPHHDTGLPDAAAHFYLGLQFLAVLIVPAALIVAFLRSSRRKNTATPKNHDQ